MSRRISEQSWGPSHQHMDPPFRRRHPVAGVLIGVPLLFMFVDLLRIALGFGGGFGSLLGWTIRAVIVLALLRFGSMLVMSVLTRERRPARTASRPPPLRTPLGRAGPTPPKQQNAPVRARVSPGARAREGVMRAGGGAYLGVTAGDEGRWVTAEPESAVMVLGPPGLVSYCTSAVSR